MVDKHLHTGMDSPKLNLKECVENAPQTALTTASGVSLSSGGSGNLKTTDSIIITNAITRIAELEQKLQNLGLLS